MVFETPNTSGHRFDDSTSASFSRELNRRCSSSRSPSAAGRKLKRRTPSYLGGPTPGGGDNLLSARQLAGGGVLLMSHSWRANRRVNIPSSFRPSSLGLCLCFFRVIDWVDAIFRAMYANVASERSAAGIGAL